MTSVTHEVTSEAMVSGSRRVTNKSIERFVTTDLTRDSSEERRPTTGFGFARTGLFTGLARGFSDMPVDCSELARAANDGQYCSPLHFRAVITVTSCTT